ncbi:Core trichothecene cluster (CTC) 10 [Hyphodiscus hymeniophilus]|uniref:Core trichothecene cluster (CTC) 10 n=1 Tax=Hyphodiscus hymeniophilus TaxID=353542 RepID=A0A9P6VR04_9HELO|nr:Core trichothecene cluster (CTC) 10 [Hyphodiscus hymeniophilus]
MGIESWAPIFCIATGGYISLETVTGCENSVLLAIADTTSLREWKATLENAATFSLPDLMERASRTENHLKRVIEECSSNMERAAIVGMPEKDDRLSALAAATSLEGFCRNSQTTAITRIFACAALVYLNVVVYGAHPDHPQIYGSVSQFATALKELRERSILGLLAWPLCVACCMASEDQKDTFRELCKEVKIVSDLKMVNLKRSLMIVEECWRLRRDTNETADWQRAMECLKMEILLI